MQSQDIQINPVQAMDDNELSKSSLIKPENNNASGKRGLKLQMQRQEQKADMREAVDAGLVVTESSGKKPDKQDISSSSGNYITQAVDADIRPVNDEEPFAELLQNERYVCMEVYNELSKRFLQLEKHCISLEISIQQKEESFHSNKPCKNKEYPEFREFFVINELKLTTAKTTTIASLRNQIKSVKEASNEAKVKNDIDVIETINIELEHSVAKLLAANEQLHKEKEHLKQTYKELYDTIKKTRVQNKDNSDSLISQINQKSVENADLKAQIQEKVFANAALKNELRKLKGNIVDSKFAKASILGKPPLQPSRNHLVVRQPNAFTSERPRISRPRFASQVDEKNDLSKTVTPYYLPKVRESAAAKPHQVNAPNYSRNSHKESYGSNDMVHAYFLENARKMTQDKTRIPSHKDMASTRAHCTPNALTTKPRNIYIVLSEFSPVSKCSGKVSNVQSPKIRNNNPVEPKNHTHKPGRQNGIGQRFSLNKSSAVHEKPHTPRSCLRWKPTGNIFKTVSLRWIPTGKMFTDNTTKVDSEPPNGSNDDITNPYECNQTLYVSAGTSNSSAGLVLHLDDIGKGNLLLDLQKLQKNPIFRISVDIRQNTNFVRAFTTSANVPSIYIQLFWNTLTPDAKTGVYSFQVDEHWLTLSADLLRKALNVTPADSAHPFESPPAASQDETTGPSVHPEDATSTKMVRETLSHADAESGGDSEKVGSNSEQSHVALAGPNPEHMHDVFLATNYPKLLSIEIQVHDRGGVLFKFNVWVPIGKYNRVLKRQKKLRNQISSALTASADVPSSVTETTDTTSTLQPPRPPLQTYSSSRYLVER
ncbi:hypothetical protein Tco_0634086 [Tanacetum coccineum]